MSQNGIVIRCGEQQDIAPFDKYGTSDARTERFKKLAPNECEKPTSEPKYSATYKTPTRQIEQSFLDCDASLFQPVPEHPNVTPLISMCHMAFDLHRPIVLSPDLLWHYICKGVATHVNLHPEELRDIFVAHEGKQELLVIRDEFILGGNNDWPGVFREFREQISANVKPGGKALIGERFSTTTETIYDVSCILLMESVQSFFSYRLRTRCGIPNITLLGKLEDWIKLLESSNKILQMFDDKKDDLNLKWWQTGLFPILEKLIACYQYPDSEDNKDWMARIYKFNREFGSGRISHVTGWVNVFFPFLANLQGNKLAKLPLLNKEDTKLGNQNGLDSFPMSLSRAPFIWEYLGQEIPMTFIGGPCCVTEQVTDDASIAPKGALHAQFGWAVGHKHGPKKSG